MILLLSMLFLAWSMGLLTYAGIHAASGRRRLWLSLMVGMLLLDILILVGDINNIANHIH